MDLPIYLTGASNDRIREAAETDLYGRLGLLVTPDTSYLANHIPSFQSWALDNACFAHAGEFDGERFLALLERTVQNVDGAHDSCLFAVAPDVFDPTIMRGDPVATIKRSLPWLPLIREQGVPAALVAQDGLQDMIDDVPWDEFDVLFLGGSDDFKLGYPDKRVQGNPHYEACAFGAANAETIRWAQLMARAHEEGKEIHVGRSNSRIRLAFSCEIGAASCDGTFLTRGPQNLDRVRRWFEYFEDEPESPKRQQLLFAA